MTLRTYNTNTKSITTWGALAAPRTNHGLNPMFDKQTSLMDASCRREDKQARRPSYSLPRRVVWAGRQLSMGFIPK